MSNYQNEDLHALSLTFQALANPNRLQLLIQIIDAGQHRTKAINSCCIGEIGRAMDIAPSTLSHHIKELQRAGLVLTERRGRHIHCRINTDTHARLVNFLAAFQSSVD
jgi:ArsR family transcriptional regulator